MSRYWTVHRARTDYYKRGTGLNAYRTLIKALYQAIRNLVGVISYNH